jgi:hypothetical protein
LKKKQNILKITSMETELQKIILKLVSRQPEQGHTLFDMLVNEILEYYNKPVHSLSEMKSVRKTKTKGDLWECFCKLYLEKVKGYDQVWLLCEVPEDVLNELGLSKRDYGIDLIAKRGSRYTAVQCKFKKPRAGHVPGTWIPYNCVNWKELSTFYALCSKTNNAKWEHHLVLTNTKYVRHMGNKTRKDRSICRGSFAKLTHFDLVGLTSPTRPSLPAASIETELASIDDQSNHLVPTPQPTPADLRAARLKYYKQ